MANTATAKPAETVETPDPTSGRIVLYTLTESDVARVEDERVRATAYGNRPHAGDVVPLIVVRPWPDRLVNGQAVLDGNDRLWITSAHEGDEPGQWHYPPRA